MKSQEEKDPRPYLDHIVESVNAIQEYTRDFSYQQFLDSRLIQDAVTRRIEIIGEAVKNLPASFREKYPNIPWKDIAGMRDKVIHKYFGVELAAVWKTVKEDIPNLEKDIPELIRDIRKKKQKGLSL